jgi:hypothetical protein
MGLLPENSLLPVTANAKMLAQSLKARQQPRTQLTGQGLLDTAAVGLSPVPVIGDALGLAADASRFYNEPESRTPLNFGLAALGLIPFVPPLVSAGLGKFAQSQGKALTAPSMSGPARNQAGAIVYHGSPHKFDQFDSSKIGTGEGAQAYGHGLYFAENPAVAKSYLDAGGGGEFLTVNKGGKEIYGDSLTPTHLEAIKLLEVGAKDAGQFKHNTAYYAKQRTKDPEVIKMIDELKDAKIGYKKHSSLYKVDLPDEAIAKMLDWDKPLSQQSKEVQKALSPYLGKPELKDGMALAGGGNLRIVNDPDFGAKYYLQMGDSKFKLSEQDVTRLVGSGLEGKSVYQNAASLLGGDLAASKAIQQSGIPGIRYLDGGSRGAGQGTSNYVVFPGNEGLLKILGRE